MVGVIAGALIARYALSEDPPPEQIAAKRDASIEAVRTMMWPCQLAVMLKDAKAVELVRVVLTGADETCVEYRPTAGAAAQVLVFTSPEHLGPPREASSCDVDAGRNITDSFAKAFDRCRATLAR